MIHDLKLLQGPDTMKCVSSADPCQRLHWPLNNSASQFCIKLERFSFFRSYFAFLDTKDYLADALFIKHQVTVKFGSEYARQDSNYVVVLCSVHKKDEARFLAALQELPGKMLLLGNTDYLNRWESLQTLLNRVAKEKIHPSRKSSRAGNR